MYKKLSEIEPSRSYGSTDKDVQKENGARRKSERKKPITAELDQAVEDTIMMEESENKKEVDGKKKEKEATDRNRVEGMRSMAMERLRETRKRAVEVGEGDIQKKKRRSGSETIGFLGETNKSEKVLKVPH